MSTSNKWDDIAVGDVVEWRYSEEAYLVLRIEREPGEDLNYVVLRLMMFSLESLRKITIRRSAHVDNDLLAPGAVWIRLCDP